MIKITKADLDENNVFINGAYAEELLIPVFRFNDDVDISDIGLTGIRFHRQVQVSGGLTCSGALHADSGLRIGKDLKVGGWFGCPCQGVMVHDGSATFLSGCDIRGNVSVGKDLLTHEQFEVDGSVTCGYMSSQGGPVIIHGTVVSNTWIHADNAWIRGDVEAADLTFHGKLDIDGRLRYGGGLQVNDTILSKYCPMLRLDDAADPEDGRLQAFFPANRDFPVRCQYGEFLGTLDDLEAGLVLIKDQRRRMFVEHGIKFIKAVRADVRRELQINGRQN